jgi:hypothetical protein
MSSEPSGIGTSSAEVANITTHGVRLLAGERGLFMPYLSFPFPFFKDIPAAKIFNVEEATPGPIKPLPTAADTVRPLPSPLRRRIISQPCRRRRSATTDAPRSAD